MSRTLARLRHMELTNRDECVRLGQESATGVFPLKPTCCRNDAEIQPCRECRDVHFQAFGRAIREDFNPWQIWMMTEWNVRKPVGK
jgi:hypothetical protein